VAVATPEHLFLRILARHGTLELLKLPRAVTTTRQ